MEEARRRPPSEGGAGREQCEAEAADQGAAGGAGGG